MRLVRHYTSVAGTATDSTGAPLRHATSVIYVQADIALVSVGTSCTGGVFALYRIEPGKCILQNPNAGHRILLHAFARVAHRTGFHHPVRQAPETDGCSQTGADRSQVETRPVLVPAICHASEAARQPKTIRAVPDHTGQSESVNDALAAFFDTRPTARPMFE